MTGRERFVAALEFRQTDRPPHFESMFELENEAFGLSFPDRNSWNCAPEEKHRKIRRCMVIYERIVERFKWDALAVYWPWGDPDGVIAAKQTFGDSIAVGGMVGAALWAIETVSDWDQFALDLIENRAALHQEARRRVQGGIDLIEKLADAGADFVFMPHDVAFNGGPFVSPKDFSEIVTPYLAQLVNRARELGVKSIFHSDGMLMPVLDQILDCGPDALQSIDPMAGMDIAEVKKLTHGKMALMGNVQCNLLQDGPDEAMRKSARYCLEHASPGGGYIYSSSNTIFPGMPLRNYEIMLEELHQWELG